MAQQYGSVGFVGLGSIGKVMATRLAGHRGGLWVYDIAPGPVEELVEAGASAAADPAELASRVDLVCVMVRDDDQVREVVGQLLGGARDGTVIAVHSTVSQETPVRLADVAARHGVSVVDAPVSGGAAGAAEGELVIMVGGSEAAYRVCAERLSPLGSRVVHAGPLGAGTRMKLARNLLHFVSFTAAAEAQRLAEAAGVDLVELGEVVRHTDAVTGGPGAIMHRPSTDALDPEDFWFGVFDHVRALGEKDLTSALKLGDELHIDLPMARYALDGLATGLGLPGSREHVAGSES